jgi:hypothetical protein
VPEPDVALTGSAPATSADKPSELLPTIKPVRGAFAARATPRAAPPVAVAPPPPVVEPPAPPPAAPPPKKKSQPSTTDFGY